MKDLLVKVKFTKVEGKNVAIINLPKKFQILSSAVLGGGFSFSNNIIILQVPHSYNNKLPEEDLLKIYQKLRLDNDTIGFMTAADIKKVLTISTESVDKIKAISIATAGVINAVIAGDSIQKENNCLNNKIGTINIISVLNVSLQKTGLANAIITMTEGKTAAMFNLNIDATGTTTDAVAIATPIGNDYKYAGTATDIGVAIAKSVKKAVSTSIIKAGENPYSKGFLKILVEKGIGIDEMWEAAKELYIPNLNWNIKTLKKKFTESLNILQKDINVNAIVLAAILLEEMGQKNKLFGLDANGFKKDPVHLLADEMLGITLAEYIAGTKGLFEYYRYDRKKPGILGKLGPFLDDIVASLIGSIMSLIYTKLLEESN